MNKVGFHTTIGNIGDREVYQVFLGSPKQYTIPDASRLEGINKDIVVHSPYWVQLGRSMNDLAFRRTLDYTIKVAKEMDRVGLKYYVTHIGTRTEDMSIAQSAKSIYTFCLKWLWETMGTNVILCLENDSGSKKGTKMGSVNILNTVIRQVNDPRVRMTFDSEHAYANGFDLSNIEKLEAIKDIVSVVHFNSIPVEVGRGSHLDRHSSTQFKDSKKGYDYLHNVYNVLYDGVRPFIMEIDDSLVEGNLEFLSSYLSNRG